MCDVSGTEMTLHSALEQNFTLPEQRKQNLAYESDTHKRQNGNQLHQSQTITMINFYVLYIF